MMFRNNSSDVVAFILDAMESIRERAEYDQHSALPHGETGWDNRYMRCVLRMQLWRCFGASGRAFTDLELACLHRGIAIAHIIGLLNSMSQFTDMQQVPNNDDQWEMN